MSPAPRLQRTPTRLTVNLPEGSTGSWHEPCLGLLLGDLCLNPVSLLWSHLCRSSSVTRSTVMKRTCRKSLQPSKVSQGCQLNSPQRAGCSLSPWHMAPQDWAAALIQPECSTSHWALRQRSPPKESGAGPFPFLCPCASAAGLLWPCPFVPWLHSVAQVGSHSPHPGPVHSQGPSTQSALCEQSLHLPLPGGASQEPLQRIDICVATVGQGGRVSAH